MAAIDSRVVGRIAPVLIGALLSACSAGGGGGDTPGTGGARTGTGGSASGTGGGSTAGTGGTTPGATGGTTPAGTGGSTPAGSGGSPAAGTGGGGSSGTGGASPADAASESAPPTDIGGDSGARPGRVLIYTRHMGTVHDMAIAMASRTLPDLFKTIGVVADVTEALQMITASNLARYGAVVLVNNAGAPFGTPGTNEIAALVAFVRAGGGLAAFHAAGNTTYPANSAYFGLLGAAFQNTGGGLRNFNCTPQGNHPTVTKFPSPFAARMEEVYLFTNHNPMNQVLVLCDPAPGGAAAKLPGSWLREEGAGRVFYTTLGHGEGMWEGNSGFLQNHAWPAILWVLGRAP